MSRESVKQIIANFWHELEREGLDIPVSIRLPARTFDRLSRECEERMRVGREPSGTCSVIYLTHGNQSMMVMREPVVPAPVRSEDPK